MKSNLNVGQLGQIWAMSGTLSFEDKNVITRDIKI